MRLIVHGQQAFGKSVLEKILDKGSDEVTAVYCAPDAGSRMDPLKAFALEKDLPLFQPASYKDEAVWEQMRGHNADLCVMAYVTLFVPEDALNIPKLGTIQYHPSLLPDHKGPSSINWPIIFGKKKTGLSIFWPDKGLDTGPILMQKHVNIAGDDTLGSLYFNHLFPMGVAAMMESIEQVRDSKAGKQAQAANTGSYESWCGKKDAEIDWNKDADEVYNLIRGTNPQPGAWTKYDGKELKVFDSGKTNGSGKPGVIIAINEDSFEVATHNGAIEIKRVRLEGRGKEKSSEFLAASELKPGVMLG